MRHLLDQENKNNLETNDNVKNIYNQFMSNYKTFYNFLNNEQAMIKFNGNTRITIDNNIITLSGFGLRVIPDVVKSPVSGCGDEGHLQSDDIKVIVNALAKYEKIFPL